MLGKGHIIFAIAGVALLGFLASLVSSDDAQVTTPEVPKAVGGSCVAPPEMMRANHMNFLKHDRDLKLQQGVTNIEASLKECVACHVVKDDAGEPVSYESPEHFCRACHDYAAVKVDCFSCHNSKPDEKAVLTAENPHREKSVGELPVDSWQASGLKGETND